MSTINSSRRTFLIQSAVLATGALAVNAATAAPALEETDPTAKALGYVKDSSKTKDAKYQKGQACNGCNFYQGKAKDKAGPCQLFPGKEVTANGWCKSWVKKAA